MKKLILYTMIALAICSCVQDPTKDLLVNIGDEEKVYATLSSEDDRVELTKSLKMVWTEGDIMYVVGPNTRKKYKFDGKTGDRGGSFTLTNTYTPYSTALDRYYAVASFYSISLMTSGRIRFNSPETGTSVQKHNPDGCSEVNNNLVFAESEDGKNFKFKGVLSYLRLSLTGDKIVKSINLINNADKAISGRYHIYIDDPETVWFKNDYNPLPTILLDCGEGVQLSDTPTDFYFAIRPMELSAGITVEVSFTDGTTFIQATSKPITITQNTIQPMAVIKTSDVEYQQINIKHTGTTFTTPTISGGTSLVGYIEFGDGATSLLNLLTSYDYTDSQTEHTISIKTRYADTIEIDNCDGIIAIDLSNF